MTGRERAHQADETPSGSDQAQGENKREMIPPCEDVLNPQKEVASCRREEAAIFAKERVKADRDSRFRGLEEAAGRRAGSKLRRNERTLVRPRKAEHIVRREWRPDALER